MQTRKQDLTRTRAHILITASVASFLRINAQMLNLDLAKTNASLQAVSSKLKQTLKMTTIASFVSKSEAGKKTLSMISDSRITWQNTTSKFDYSQKLFRLDKSLDVFGYCGDSLFCLAILSQITSYLNHSTDFQNSKAIINKKNIIFSLLEDSLSQYPEKLISENFRIYWNSIFKDELYCFKYSFDIKTGRFEDKSIPIDSTTSLVFSDGSGKTQYDSELGKLDSKFSRSYFKALANVIENSLDIKTGGPPQMLSLRLFNKDIQATSFLYNKKYFLNGVHDKYSSNIDKVEFRDMDFNFLTPDGKVRNNYKGSFTK